MEWFSVDKEGLAKLLERRGKVFAIYELVSNAWDTDARVVTVKLEPVAGRPLVRVSVEDDDPNGFANLAHAFTLFAESEKKGCATKRGRFCLGEKLTLALCDEAFIASTRGTVYFDAAGRRESRRRRKNGSQFYGIMRMTRAEYDDVLVGLAKLQPPVDCATRINGERLAWRDKVGSVSAELPTEIADAEGYLRKSTRGGLVTFHRVSPGETATLYEMGIPVVELDDGTPWHINVHQKVPLGIDRDNVSPAFLRTLNVLMANEMHERVAHHSGDKLWLARATDDARASPKAVEAMLVARFGEKRATFDPSDPEASKQLLNEGYALIHGGSLSAGQWEHVRKNGLAPPAGAIRPSGTRHDPNGRPERVIAPEDYTDGLRRIVRYTQALGSMLLQKPIEVTVVNEPVALPHLAWYGSGRITFNLGRLGRGWFERPLDEAHHELILHELAHDKVGDHLTREFADEVARLGVALLRVALLNRAWFVEHGYAPTGVT